MYVLQPPGFTSKGKEEKVLRLKKALYGLKQEPRAWNKRIYSLLNSIGFRKCSAEHGVYVHKVNEQELVILC